MLWETLPPDVMDAAIRCHHDVLRGLLQPHGGYESATGKSGGGFRIGVSPRWVGARGLRLVLTCQGCHTKLSMISVADLSNAVVRRRPTEGDAFILAFHTAEDAAAYAVAAQVGGEERRSGAFNSGTSETCLCARGACSQLSPAR
mgnify:CR=1 FL=1